MHLVDHVCVAGMCWSDTGSNSGRSLWRQETRTLRPFPVRLTTPSCLRVSVMERSGHNVAFMVDQRSKLPQAVGLVCGQMYL